MSIRVMTDVWENAPVSGGPLLVLLALADFANDQGECWPSVNRLAEKSRLSERQTRAVLRSLENSGLLRTEAQGGRYSTNHYVVLPRGAVSAPLRGEVSGSRGEVATSVRGEAHCPQTVSNRNNRHLVTGEPNGSDGSNNGSGEISDMPDFRDPQIVWLEERYAQGLARRDLR